MNIQRSHPFCQARNLNLEIRILKPQPDQSSATLKNETNIRYLDRILHDDLLFIIPNGQTITKQMDLESHRRGDMTVESLVPDFENIRILGDVATVISCAYFMLN